MAYGLFLNHMPYYVTTYTASKLNFIHTCKGTQAANITLIVWFTGYWIYFLFHFRCQAVCHITWNNNIFFHFVVFTVEWYKMIDINIPTTIIFITNPATATFHVNLTWSPNTWLFVTCTSLELHWITITQP